MYYSLDCLDHGQEQKAKSHKKRPKALDTGTRYHNNNYYTQEDRKHHADEPGRPKMSLCNKLQTQKKHYHYADERFKSLAIRRDLWCICKYLCRSLSISVPSVFCVFRRSEVCACFSEQEKPTHERGPITRLCCDRGTPWHTTRARARLSLRRSQL